MWSAPGTRSWPCAPLRRRAGAGARATEAQSVADRIDKLIAEEIPPKLERDTSYQNAMANGDRQNARIEHDEALGRIITAMVKDDAQLYQKFFDDPTFRRWLQDVMFGATYRPPEP